MPQIDRLPASTALPSYSSAPPPEEEDEAAAESIELRRELRSSDRALSDLRTELWQAQERCRRLATEVWRMDGERTRLRAVQGELGAELSVVLGVLRLQPPVPASERDSTEWELELRGLALAASTLRQAVGEEPPILIPTRQVREERTKWRSEMEALSLQLSTLQQAIKTKELKEAAKREADAAREEAMRLSEIKAEREAHVLAEAREEAAMARLGLPPPPPVTSSHRPSGCNGFTLGPPNLLTNRPLVFKKLSLIISADNFCLGYLDK